MPYQRVAGMRERLMAEIWLWRDGDDATTGGALANLPLADCITKLRVGPNDYCGDLCTPPRFKTSQPPPKSGVQVVMGSPHLWGYRHVIIRLDDAEARANGWAPGFYRSLVSPEDACQLLCGKGHEC